MRPNKDTALFNGYVLRYETQSDGTKVIVSDVWDDPIDTRKLVGSDDAIRDGWEEDEATRDKFVKGKAVADAYAATGGAKTHTHPTHAEAGSCAGITSGGDAYCLKIQYADHTAADHTPEWVAYKWIKRTS